MRINTYATQLCRTGAVDYAVQRIDGPASAITVCIQLFAPLLSKRPQEEFWVVTLSTKNKVIGLHHITTGTLDASLVHPREVFRAAILDSSSSIILVHNHPSGDPTPSREDRAVTTRLTEVGKLIGIEVLDHIVLAWAHDGHGFGQGVSIRES